MKKRLAGIEENNVNSAADLADLKEIVDDNNAKMNNFKQDMIEKLKEFELARTEIIDVLGPKFAGLKSQADSTINDAKRKFEETDNELNNIITGANRNSKTSMKH